MRANVNKFPAMLLLVLVWMLLWLLVARSWGGVITPGYTWVTGESVTASKMNAMINSAVINSSFHTSRSSTTDPAGSETILIYDYTAAAFKTITVDALLQRTNLVTDLAGAGTLSTNDLLLIVNGGALSKVTLGAFLSGLYGTGGLDVSQLVNTNVLHATANKLGVIPGAGLAGGTNSALSLSYSTNGLGVVSNALTLLYNTNGLTINGAGQLALNYDTNTLTTGTDGKLSVNNSTLFTSIEYPVTPRALYSTNHGFSVTPTWMRWVMVCKTNNLHYRVGDEVDITSFHSYWGQNYNYYMAAAFGTYANSSNVSCTVLTEDVNLLTYGVGTNFVEIINQPSWRLKCYAKP